MKSIVYGIKTLFFSGLFFLASCSGIQKESVMKMVVFTKTTDYRHDNIPVAVEALKNMALENNWSLFHTEDPNFFTSESLDTLDLLVFLQTTGDIFQDEQKQAIEEFVMGGGGLLTIHTGTVTENNWAWYTQMMGARFIGHPPVQEARLIIENRDHPATSFFTDSVWVIEDEWYSFDRNPRPDVHVLISIDESSYYIDDSILVDGVSQRMGDHPMVWYRYAGKGRVFQTALGHTFELYTDPLFLNHIRGAIVWTAGREDL